jgi:ribosomal protein L19E
MEPVRSRSGKNSDHTSRINLDDAREVEYWMKRLRVTRAELEQLVKQVRKIKER